MTQNLKIDIIYYNNPSDFEFEFNLGGCCETRILSDTPTNRKEFINSLSRAVSRSRVVFIIGNIYGDDNIIELTSKAISYPLCDIDRNLYNFDDNNCKILTGSLPLVGMDGHFGGCIVEKGPQSIILLTKEKSVRKSIMSHLVNSYITALSMTNGTDGIISDPTDLLENQNETIEMTPDTVTDEADIELAETNEESANTDDIEEPDDVENSSPEDDYFVLGDETENESEVPEQSDKSENSGYNTDGERIDIYDAVIHMKKQEEDTSEAVENPDIEPNKSSKDEENDDYALNDSEEVNPDDINFHLDKNEDKYPNVKISNEVRKIKTVLFVLLIFLFFFMAFSLYLVFLITNKNDQGVFEYFETIISTLFGR